MKRLSHQFKNYLIALNIQPNSYVPLKRRRFVAFKLCNINDWRRSPRDALVKLLCSWWGINPRHANYILCGSNFR